MAEVLTNKFHHEEIEEAQNRDLQYQIRMKNSKFDAKKFFTNRAQQIRVDFNKKKLSEFEKDEYEHLLGKPKLFTKGKIGNFFPSNKVNRLLTFKDEMNTIANDGAEANPQNETA